MLVLFVWSCKSSPYQEKAEEFMDYYYIQADIYKAISYTQDFASVKIKNEIDSLKQYGRVTDAYRSRDIWYEFVSEKGDSQKVQLRYKLFIQVPDQPKMTKVVLIEVNADSKKVTFFAEN